jgi:hypothetical protein
MNACLLPEVVNRRASTPQQDLPLAAEGVLRYVWEGRFGAMLIEVRDEKVYVNGDLVQAAVQSGSACGVRA